MTSTPAISRVSRVRHEAKRRDLSVARVQSISLNFVAVTFTGAGLADFTSLSFDDHVKLILNAGSAEPIMRDYTPRRFDRDARELTLEFSLHGDGPAARWAAQAQPGQQVVVGGPRGSMIIPMDFDWHLLAGDETALPAVARRLEELPSQAQVLVVVQVADLGDRRDLASRANVDVQWVTDSNQLIGSIRRLTLPKGSGFAWCAGESSVVRTLRDILVREKSQERHAIRAAAYWKQGLSAHHENLED